MIKTIQISPYHLIQGVHVETLPDGRAKVRIDKAKCIPCKWRAGFLHNYCASCGRDEAQMAGCPSVKTKDEFHYGNEIERSEECK